MFDIKQLDNAYDPAEQIQIALGVHPDQADAQKTTADALAKAGISPSVNMRTGQTFARDASGNWQPSGAPDPNKADDIIAPIARPNGARAINMPSPEATATVSGAVPPIASGSTLQSAVAANPMSGNDARLAGHKTELDRLQNSTDHSGNVPTGGASGIAQIQNPFLRGLARVGDIAGKVMFPTIEREIPGTEGHHQALVNEAQGNVASDLGEQSKELALTHQKLENDALDNKPAPTPKPIFDQAGDLIAFQNGDDLLGPKSPKLTPDMRDMMDAAKGKKPAGGTPESQAMADLQTQKNPSTNKPYTPYEAFQKINAEKAEGKPDTSAQDDQRYEQVIQNQRLGKPVSAEDKAFAAAYKDRKTLGQTTTFMLQNGGTGPGSPAYENNVNGVATGKLKIENVLTPRTPLSVRQQFLSDVMNANPQFKASDFDIEKGVTKSATSGKIGDELNAYNTAIVHADLLQKAATALNNGDIRAINSIGNQLGVQFGSDKKTNFDIIRNAYTAEVTKALTSGHITDTELHEQKITLPDNAGPDQFSGAVNAYRALMASKKQIRRDQIEKGQKAQPNYGDDKPADNAQHPEEKKYPGFVVDQK